jgi:hypothetical protein
MDETW